MYICIYLCFFSPHQAVLFSLIYLFLMGVVGLRELVHINKLNTDVQQIEGNNSKWHTFRRLSKLPVLWRHHFFLQLSQYVLHCILPLPIGKHREKTWFHLLFIYPLVYQFQPYCKHITSTSWRVTSLTIPVSWLTQVMFIRVWNLTLGGLSG